MAAAFHFGSQRNKRALRVGRVVQDADAKRIIERLFEGQFENVCLHDVRVGQLARGRERGLHRRA